MHERVHRREAEAELNGWKWNFLGEEAVAGWCPEKAGRGHRGGGQLKTAVFGVDCDQWETTQHLGVGECFLAAL